MNTAQDDGPRCSRCRAPVSRSGGRCPFCGAAIEGTDGARPFEPAIVGMSDQYLSGELARKHGTAQPDARRRPLLLAVLAAVALVALVVLSGVGLVLSRRDKARVDQVPSAAAPPPPSASTSAPLNVHGVAIDTPDAVDPTDALPAVKRSLAEAGRFVSLVGIEVVHATRGAVDLGVADARITYRLLVTDQGMRARGSAPRPDELVVLTLAADPPAVARSAPGRRDKPVIEPTCVWSAAWRAAVASGISPSEPVDATFGPSPSSDAGVWVFTPRQRPAEIRHVDGRTCAIKTR